MPELENLTPPPRKVMTLFLLIDTSGSMSGDKIESVSSAIEEVKAQLDDISKSNDDAEIRLAVLTFSTGVEWLTPKPVSPNGIDMNTLTASGLTSLGAACIELESKLSRTEFLDTKAGAYPPVIILLSDGGPTDNFESGLNKLKHNNWFKRAIKVAFAIGQDADRKVLSDFTCNNSGECVINVNEARILKDLLKKIVIITSVFQSRSKDTDANEDATEVSADLMKTAKEEYIEEKKNESGNSDVPDDPDDPFAGWGTGW